MKVNKRLIWDYDFSEKDFESEPFKDWYFSRVLDRGRVQDIRDIGGVESIRTHFLHLHLPLEVERLWSWYLKIPGPRSELYDHPQFFTRRFP